MKHLLKSAKTRSGAVRESLKHTRKKHWRWLWFHRTVRRAVRTEGLVCASTSHSVYPLRALRSPPITIQFKPGSEVTHRLVITYSGRPCWGLAGTGRQRDTERDDTAAFRLRAAGVDTCRRMCSEFTSPHCGRGPRLKTALLT